MLSNRKEFYILVILLFLTNIKLLAQLDINRFEAILFGQVINDQKNLKTYNNLMDTIEGKLKDSVIFGLDSTKQWKLICWKKEGWESYVIPGGGLRSIDYDDIRLPSKPHKITYSELKDYFQLVDSRFSTDSLGNKISSPDRMTKDKRYLVIGRGSSYPHGNQSSWQIIERFYFISDD